MHPALQQRRRHVMPRPSTRRGTRTGGLVPFTLVVLGVFGLTFVGSVMGTAGGMFAASSYFASGLPTPRLLPCVSTERMSLTCHDD